jgi:hypothetical protein
VGSLLRDLDGGRFASPKLRHRIESVLRDGNAFADVAIEHDVEPGGKRTLKVSGSRVLGLGVDDDGKVALLSLVDTTV